MKYFQITDGVWVCGDVAEVAMVVDNPLPVEIKVSNMVGVLLCKLCHNFVTFFLFKVTVISWI